MDKDASTIRQEIEQTRMRMGDTVEALAYKTDVKARVKENVDDRVSAVKGTIGDMVDGVKSAVVGSSDGVGESGNANERSASNALSRTRDKINDTVDKVNTSVSDRLADADVNKNAQRAVGMVKENPIGLALAALAVGFLTGSLIPVSDEERKRLKPIGDKIVSQAQAATNDLVEAGKAVVAETAQNAVSTAFGSAKSHGQDVVDAAKTRASSTN